MISKRLRLEQENGCIPKSYIEIQISHDGGASVVAHDSIKNEEIPLKFDEHEFVNFCEEYLKIVRDEGNKNE